MSAKQDHHFPRYHVRPPSGWLNDPNGPVLIDGRWHIYYQYRPPTAGNSPVFWGHASSHDGAHWRNHRAAISPDSGGVDRGGAWSGNTVSHDGIVTAFYSAYSADNRYQSVVAADSVDGGFSFGRPRQALPDPTDDQGIVLFRDPFVFPHADGWRMVVGAGDVRGVASVRLYSSEDLTTWRFSGNLAELPRTQLTAADDPAFGDAFDSGEMWECPQVIESGSMTALFVSCYSESGGIMRVMTAVGSSHETPMNDVRYAPYDQGLNFYAASAQMQTPFGPVVWGWATEARDREWCIEADWCGMLTLPRHITVSADGLVRSAPIPSLTGLREGALADGPAARRPIRVGAQFEIDARIEEGIGSARFRVRFSEDEHLDVLIDRDTREVLIDRSAASSDPRAVGGSCIVRAPSGANGALGVRAFVDGSILELFTSDGQCATVRFYPSAAPQWSLEITETSDRDRIAVWSLGDATDETDAVAAAAHASAALV